MDKLSEKGYHSPILGLPERSTPITPKCLISSASLTFKLAVRESERVTNKTTQCYELIKMADCTNIQFQLQLLWSHGDLYWEEAWHISSFLQFQYMHYFYRQDLEDLLLCKRKNQLRQYLQPLNRSQRLQRKIAWSCLSDHFSIYNQKKNQLVTTSL